MIAPIDYAVQSHKDEDRWYGRLILSIVAVSVFYFAFGVLVGIIA